MTAKKNDTPPVEEKDLAPEPESHAEPGTVSSGEQTTAAADSVKPKKGVVPGDQAQHIETPQGDVVVSVAYDDLNGDDPSEVSKGFDDKKELPGGLTEAEVAAELQKTRPTYDSGPVVEGARGSRSR